MTLHEAIAIVRAPYLHQESTVISAVLTVRENAPACELHDLVCAQSAADLISFERIRRRNQADVAFVIVLAGIVLCIVILIWLLFGGGNPVGVR